MPIFKLQVSMAGDSALPRDRMVITPHFNDQGVGTDPQELCEDLAAALSPWCNDLREITVKAYDAQGTPPVYPVGDAIINADTYPASGAPREIALCLSFYSERNTKRNRGRLYIPWCVLSAGAGVRPTEANRIKVGTLATILSDLGGVDVDWCVYSRLDDAARPVTNWWVDDEWDTIRSRGLRPTTRTAGTTTEA